MKVLVLLGSSSSSSSSSVNESNIRVINISEDFDINNEVTEITELPEQKEHKETDKKMIDIDVDSETDYKKMSLGKLRHIVVDKKLTQDASKLKKIDLLKLLSIENV